MKIKEKIYFLIGLMSTFLAILGIFLPLLPTVPFLLLALFCFNKSSKKYYNMIIKNKYFGKDIENYYKGRGISKGKKIKIILFLTLGIFFSIYKVEHFHLKIFLFLVWLFVSIHISLIKNNTKTKK